MPTKSKVISPAALVALKEALASVYWYKRDLKSFLTNCLSTPQILSRIDWDDYKQNIVGRLIDFLARHEDQYQADLLRLMNEVV